MSGFELLPLSGGAPVPVPPGETVLGRGPLLGISDKRVSRNHALLENCDGRLRLKSTHVNPVFLQSGSDPEPSPLTRDQWTVLQPGDTVSLLPGHLCYRVLGKPDQDQDQDQNATQEQSPDWGLDQDVEQGTDQHKKLEREEEPVGTPRNSQVFEEEAGREESPHMSDPIGPQPTHTPPSRRIDQSRTEEEPSSLKKSPEQTLNQSFPPPRPRVLPAWMMSAAQSCSSSYSPGVAKRGKTTSSDRKQTTPSQKAPPPVMSSAPKASLPIMSSAPKAPPQASSSASKAPPQASSSASKAPPPVSSSASKAPPPVSSSASKAPPPVSSSASKAPTPVSSSASKAPPPVSSSASKAPPSVTSSAPRAAPLASEGAGQSDEEEEQLPKKRRKMNGSERSSVAPAPAISPEPSPEPSPGPDPGPGLRPTPVSAAAKASSTTTKRPPCPYGKDCYRKNPLHFQEESHPGDQDYEDPDQDSDQDSDRPECPYGTDCYRKNPLHRKEFKHTKRPARKTRAAAPKRRADDEDEDDEDEYESSFIDSESDYEPPAQRSSSESEDLSQLQREASHFVKGRK